ncbi:uncharacterized protein [Montipora capricornis]|uniref:uncharacterized protein n=1 Tax=Montipora capricornis TaxID=246305 RepID=UPI0035F1F188
MSCPSGLAKHTNKRKADRGFGKKESKEILRYTGVFVPAGSGICRDCRERLAASLLGETSIATPSSVTKESLTHSFAEMSLVHVCEGSTVADRCRLFALSDCKDPAFYDDCKHSHDDCCDRCELLASTMDDEIDNTLVKNESNLSDDDCDEMRFLVKRQKLK